MRSVGKLYTASLLLPIRPLGTSIPTKTLTRNFPSIETALDAITSLERAGFARCNITLKAGAHGDRRRRPSDRSRRQSSNEAIITMGILGAVIGSIAGMSILFIPGIGLEAEAGIFGLIVTGAILGGAILGLVGSLVGLLLEHDLSRDTRREDADRTSTGTLVSVVVQPRDAPKARNVLEARRVLLERKIRASRSRAI
jgi:hypothetical protein